MQMSCERCIINIFIIEYPDSKWNEYNTMSIYFIYLCLITINEYINSPKSNNYVCNPLVYHINAASIYNVFYIVIDYSNFIASSKPDKIYCNCSITL